MRSDSPGENVSSGLAGGFPHEGRRFIQEPIFSAANAVFEDDGDGRGCTYGDYFFGKTRPTQQPQGRRSFLLVGGVGRCFPGKAASCRMWPGPWIYVETFFARTQAGLDRIWSWMGRVIRPRAQV